jgi:hypothetical protein
MGFNKFGDFQEFDSCNKFGGGEPLFHESKAMDIATAQQQYQNMKEYFIPLVQNVMDALVPVVQNIFAALNPYILEVAENLTTFYNALIHTYPNKRVVWLATHHKSARVRKKNRKRIMKWIEREGKKEWQKSNGSS